MTHNTTELARRFQPEMLARERSAPTRPAGTKARVERPTGGFRVIPGGGGVKPHGDGRFSASGTTPLRNQPVFSTPQI
jgi:hypothetical protein